MNSIPHFGNEKSVTEKEAEILEMLVTPALISTTTGEFANLKKLGLVFLEDASGKAGLTPLGKAWIASQATTRRTP